MFCRVVTPCGLTSNSTLAYNTNTRISKHTTQMEYCTMIFKDLPVQHQMLHKCRRTFITYLSCICMLMTGTRKRELVQSSFQCYHQLEIWKHQNEHGKTMKMVFKRKGSTSENDHGIRVTPQNELNYLGNHLGTKTSSQDPFEGDQKQLSQPKISISSPLSPNTAMHVPGNITPMRTYRIHLTRDPRESYHQQNVGTHRSTVCNVDNEKARTCHHTVRPPIQTGQN